MEPNDAIENVSRIEDQNEFSIMLDDVLSTLTDTMYNPSSVSPTSSASPSPTFTNISQPSIQNLERIRIKVVEQPAMKGLRFRYICEGRSAGSIPGVHATPENKTFPTIEIEGYEGKVKVVVSCVTKNEPYRPHPHNLVGKEGCEHGVCLATINGPPMRAVFSNLGIQCVKKKDIKAALEERERKRIDPFKTSFAHKEHPSSIDLNVVRLCFQAFIPVPGGKKPFPIPPVVSDPIFDKKSINDLVICRLCSCAAKVTGGDKIILLCEKVPKDDIKVRFFELRSNELFWEDFGEFHQTDVHKQAAIAFKTPRYINPEVNQKVQVYIQLYRPSDGETSEALPFEFYPDPDNIKRKRIKTGGNPLNILREIQQLEQSHSNISNYTSVDSSSMWNIQPSMQSPSSNASTITEVKAEPFLSPNCFSGSYRRTYLTTPSPQPTSPIMNRNLNTPSPGLMRSSSTESPTQILNFYNQINQEHLANNFNLSTTITCNQTSGASIATEYNNSNLLNNPNTFYNNNNFNITSSQQQMQFTSTNIFINRTSGGSFTPIYTDNNSNKNNSITTNNNNLEGQTTSMTNDMQQVQTAFGMTNSSIFNQFQDPNTTTDPSLFNLSQLDDLVPLQNSDELRMSNLSIST